MIWTALQCASANDLIKVQFVQRPPYMYQTDSGAVEGLLINRVEQIFSKAGIAMEWNLTSVNRQWDALMNPNEMTCSIGWYKSESREKIAKFTKAIYQDQQHVLLARKQFSIQPSDRLETLLKMKRTRVLVKNKYTYGPKIDGMLKAFKTTTILSDAENQQMVRLLIANRADFMVTSKLEADYLLANSDPYNDLRIVIPVDMPEAGKRYIACNRLVSDALIERLNKAIPF